MVKITQYTDPMCIWCLALEPVMRKIDYLMGDDVKFDYVLGLLVGDVKEIIGDDAFSGMRFKQLQKQMREHFLDAGRRSGIPVDPAFGEDTRQEDVTSLPMSLAVKAVELQSKEVAMRYLRRIRECAHNEKMQMGRQENLLALLDEFPAIDKTAYLKALEDGSAAEALQKDLTLSHSRGIHSFPTTLVTCGDQAEWISGYHGYGLFKELIEKMTGKQLVTPDYSFEAATEFVSHYERVMARELQVLFELGDDELRTVTEELLASGMFEREDRGSSYYIKVKQFAFCDPSTGLCG